MKKYLFLSLSLALLLALLGIVKTYFDAPLLPLALSRSAFDSSLAMKTLGTEFVLHRPLDAALRLRVHQLINRRKKEWTPEAHASIPHIIHQIWPSNEPIPDQFIRASIMVREQHPDFQYIIWRPGDYEPLIKEAFDTPLPPIAPEVTRDIVAAIVAWRFGGIVVDLEAECVQPITPLLSLGQCILGMEPPLPRAKRGRRLFISSSVIATVPSHPLVLAYLTEMVHRVRNGAINTHWITQDALTTAVSEHALECPGVLVLGPSYFCPVGTVHIRHLNKRLEGELDRTFLQKIAAFLHLTPPFSEVSRDTIFVHMSGGRASSKAFDKIALQT
jgi:mannosyltransferase OCH1-like enzyme